jgi:hypothetical protein
MVGNSARHTCAGVIPSVAAHELELPGGLASEKRLATDHTLR